MYQRAIHYQAENRLIQEQDQHIEQITQIAKQMKNQGKQMNRQLQLQNNYAHRLGYQMDITTGKLNSAQAKLGHLLDTQDSGQICTCLMLTCLMIVFLLCLFLI